MSQAFINIISNLDKIDMKKCNETWVSLLQLLDMFIYMLSAEA